jgi:hypothetical protein
MKIDKHISIVDPYPCIYIDDILLISDTHLGLEEQRERLGISIPISVTDTIIEYIIESIKELDCKKVIFLGDVKHEFGKPSSEEWFAVRKMIKSIRDAGGEPEVVRGNHDNYILNILKSMDVRFHDPYLSLDRYFLMHGHLELEDKFDDSNYIFLGHEHPAITILDDVNAKHRFKAFLVGAINNRKIIVLPSASPLAYGNPVNELDKNELLSIFLRKYGIDEFTPYLIEVGEAVKRFPIIKHLRL